MREARAEGIGNWGAGGAALFLRCFLCCDSGCDTSSHFEKQQTLSTSQHHAELFLQLHFSLTSNALYRLHGVYRCIDCYEVVLQHFSRLKSIRALP
eukprot:scaffold19685_cov116-Skeletonema_dohrnii-CCMP3373.AAC.3